ncbi:MAG: CRISPR-associated endoribonuclease Cas6 [Spirochaetes bacterium]|nr:CRISPR-associated endoribonuclease Cas6 [Spirochaetota bacterium]
MMIAYLEFCQSFVNNILNSKIKLGNNELDVNEATVIPIEVDKDEILIETLSPIVTYSILFKHDGSKYTIYFKPGEKEFNSQINLNLLNKYKAFYNKLDIEKEIKIKSFSKIRENIIEYKGFLIKGYSGIFNIVGSKKLLEFGIATGFGEKNSMGFGCVKLLKNK